jgi:DNA phosphorothioation-associated DGQHR protein 1
MSGVRSMRPKAEYPLRLPAIRVLQPLGLFYVASIPAHVLLQVAYSDVLSASLASDNSGYVLEGTQRLSQPKRLSQIADYIDRQDSAFPNSIILAANFRPDGTFEGSDDDGTETEGNRNESREWTISEELDGCYTLEIPPPTKLAAIVDGQHRLFGFVQTKEAARLNMELLCSIYLDLPKPFQAQLFATINSTQKPVDKSLTYELFGYNISEEKEEFWTPDKLAVFLTRKLNTESQSALNGWITIAPRRDASLTALLSRSGWKVSTAVVVEGILRLITSNPKRDTNEMRSQGSSSRLSLEGKFSDKSPLRDVYFKGNDALIYTMVLNYLHACDVIFWEGAKPESFIFRTAGVQALFAVLRNLAKGASVAKDISSEYFSQRLNNAAQIDFAADEFRSSSGAGRTHIRRAIERAIGLYE